MKVEVTYKLPCVTEEIDLTDYGHEDHVKWEDLTEDQQTEISDGLRENYFILTTFETIEP